MRTRSRTQSTYTSCLHTGHEPWSMNHLSTQGWWKVWEHFGNFLTVSPATISWERSKLLVCPKQSLKQQNKSPFPTSKWKRMLTVGYHFRRKKRILTPHSAGSLQHWVRPFKFIGHIQNKMLILLIKKAQPRETDIEKALLEWLRRMNIKSVHILRLKGQIVLQNSHGLTRVPSNCMLNFRVKINRQKSWQLFENKSSNH